MLVKGSYYTGTDDGAVNLIKADDGRYLSYGESCFPFYYIGFKVV